MARYPAFSIFRNALSGQKQWQRVWRAAEPMPAYDVVIIGGGGNVGRNTTFTAVQQAFP